MVIFFVKSFVCIEKCSTFAVHLVMKILRIDAYETFDLDNRHGCHDGGMPNKHHNHD